MKKIIKLSESDLHKIIKNTVKRVVKESSNPYWGDNEDEKIRKRNDNYIDDINGDGPSIYDTVGYEDNPEEMETRIALKRRAAHNTHPETYDDDMYESRKRTSIKLTESELHKLIENTVKNVINEVGDTEKGQKALGALTARQANKARNTDHNKNSKEWSKNMLEPAKTFLHAKKNAKGNEEKWGNKSFTDKEHPFNKGYDEYEQENESLNRIIRRTIKEAFNTSNDNIKLYKGYCSNTGKSGIIIGEPVTKNDRDRIRAYEHYAESKGRTVIDSFDIAIKPYDEVHQDGEWVLFVPEDETESAYWYSIRMDGVGYFN